MLKLLTLFALVGASRAKCIGTSCTETDAVDDGVIRGGSDTVCRGRDREFAYNPSWQTTLDAELFTLAWSGADDEWVWAVTTGTNDMLTVSARKVYWSNDHGRTMHDKTPEMIELITTKSGAGFEDFASVNRIIVHSEDPNKVLLWGDESFAFRSNDGGANLTLVNVPEGTKGVSHLIKPHPTRPDWLLSLAYRAVCFGLTGYGCAMDLWYSQDFGASWSNLTAAAGGQVAGFLQFDWGYHNDDPKYQDLFEESTILATGHHGIYPSPRDVLQDDTFLFRSDDFFQSTDTLASCGGAFALVAGQVFFVHPDVCSVDVNGNNAPRKSATTRLDSLTLYVSRDGSDFEEVCLPTQLSDEAYTLISTQDGRGAFMIADHIDNDAAVSNLYANGNVPELYTLSLRNVRYGYHRDSRPDIKALQPIYGRWMANVLESAQENGPVIDSSFNAVAVTKVTHNSGASWKLITVDPNKVKHPVCKAACENGKPCYLHLHGESSWVRGQNERPSVYASPSAPGIVMASGNLGPERQGLQIDKDLLCTWLSRDGGLTWEDVIDDVYIYEYLNHGNVIAMAKFREEGNAEYVHVSLDQGQCFYKIRIVPENSTDMKLYVNNIMVEPDGAATILHIAGTQVIESLNKRQDVILTIDVREELNKPDVNGAQLQLRAACDMVKDTEEWTVADEANEALCILGQEHTFVRMKVTTGTDGGCFLPKDYAFTNTTKVCDCGREDFYCEYGFEKAPKSNSKCIPMINGDSAPVCEAIELEAYTPSASHLRLAHGQTCPNLETYIKDTDGNGLMEHPWAVAMYKKRHGESGSGASGWLVAIVVAVLAGAVFVAYKYGPDSVREAGDAAVEGGMGMAVWVVDRVKGVARSAQAGRGPEELGFERLAGDDQEALYAVP